MREWYTLMELADAKLPDMPTTKRGMQGFADRAGWSLRADKIRIASRRGGGLEYHVSLLPAAARSKLAFMEAAAEPEKTEHSKLLWQRFEALSKEHRATCKQRLDILLEVEDMREAGVRLEDALALILRKHGISDRTYFNWRQMVSGAARADWLAALAPMYSGADGTLSEFAECHPLAWDTLKSDYLRPEKPGFSACYRRMAAAAKRKGWAPIPSERSLRRRLKAEVPKSAQIYAREGKRKAAELFPAQTRSKGHLHAMEIVNTDGHKLDLFVQVPWNDKPDRVILLGIQDVYSGKVLSWRLCQAETWDAVRSTIGDMIENEGGKLPSDIYMDNGRAFASKKVSGGMKWGRHRFKVTEDEVAGLLVTLGIRPHFTTPYSGRSKPVERAWKDLAEEICKHPKMAGCYTGNKPDAKPENYRERAVPLDVLQAHVADMIAEHNARPGRRSDVARGRSFNEVFEESVRHPSTVIRVATPDQRSLWLLAAEKVKARKPSGQIHLERNIYWAPALNEWIGKSLTVRFNPSKLHDPVKVYDPSGRFICDAECQEQVGFNDIGQARRTKKLAQTLVKHKRAVVDLHRKLSAEQLAEVYDDGKVFETPPVVRPAVTRLITGNVAHAEQQILTDEEISARFSRGIAILAEEAGAIIPFPSGNTPGRKPGKARTGN